MPLYFLVLLKPGIQPVLGSDVEKELYDFIVDSQRYGNGLSGKEIKHSAWQLATQYNSKEIFGEAGPSNGFLDRYLKRHPNLRLRKPEALSTVAGAGRYQEMV